jgi:hypothetical protein
MAYFDLLTLTVNLKKFSFYVTHVAIPWKFKMSVFYTYRVQDSNFVFVLLWARPMYYISSFCIKHRNEMSNWNILFTPSKLTQRIRMEYPFHICMSCKRRIQNILLYAPCIGPVSNAIFLSRHSFLRKVFFNLRANLIGRTESIESIVRYQSCRWHCSKVHSSQ